MKTTEIIIGIGFGMVLIWGGFYVGMEDNEKKKRCVIWVGVIIDIILWAISRNFLVLFGGILMGIAVGSLKEGFNYLFRKMGIRDRHVMYGWKNWVILSVITFVMMLSTIAIVVMIQ